MTRTISVANITWRENQVTHIMSIMSIEFFTTETFTKSHFLLFWGIVSVNGCCGQLIQEQQFTYKHETFCGHCDCFVVTGDIYSFCCVSLNFDVIVPLIKSFYLLQRRIKRNCLWNVNCCTQKREIKVIQNMKFSQNREIYVSRNMRTWKSRPKHVAKITCNKVFQNVFKLPGEVQLFNLSFKQSTGN